MLRPWKLEIQLDHQSTKPLYLQLADAIIVHVTSGRLPSGTVLPGSRILAGELGLNRNTIVEALNVLISEQWLMTRERKGTFVSDILPIKKQVIPESQPMQVSGTGQSFRIGFDDGHPDSKIAPVKELARAYRQIFNRKAKWQMMGYGSPLGDLDFRGAICQMLNQQRGLHARAEQLCITRGSQMAMYLTAQCLIRPGDYVLVEDPGYSPAWRTFTSAGAKLLPVRTDGEGLVLADIISHLGSGKKIRAIYTTPHHHYPTTVTLSPRRRLELVSLSNQYGFTIIEDDYDNEFHYGYRPILPISSLEQCSHYIYIGTMSKVIAPALRIGYLSSSITGFIDKVADLRKIIDVQGDVIMEQAVLQLIQDGTIRRHLKKATLFYRDKRDQVKLMLDRYLTGKATYQLPDGGLAFWLVPVEPADWTIICKKLELKGIQIIRPETYHLDSMPSGIRLSFGSLALEQIEEGIIALSRLL